MKVQACLLLSLAFTVSFANATSGPAVGSFGFGFTDWFVTLFQMYFMNIVLSFLAYGEVITALFGNPGWYAPITWNLVYNSALALPAAA